jgi:flagellar motor protein MotB
VEQPVWQVRTLYASFFEGIMKTLVSGLLMLILASKTFADDVVKETILFLQEDGLSHLTYTTARTRGVSYDLYLDKQEWLKDYLYIYPNEYRFDRESDSHANILHFSQGDYATISPGDFRTRTEVSEGGVYHFSSWDGKQRPDGHFGFWNQPDDFSQFVYVWVLPKNFEFIAYKSNRPGDWVQRHNTLAFYGKDVNDLSFNIDYRLRSHETYAILKESFRDQKQVKVEQRQQGVKVTLAETVLFPSGSSELSSNGRKVINALVQGLSSRSGVTVVVNGHTDSIPIRERLKKKFQSNWELSSARAMAVVHRMEELGFSGERLEARAYGPYRPRASNRTVTGRAENRRIEIEIVEANS